MNFKLVVLVSLIAVCLTGCERHPKIDSSKSLTKIDRQTFSMSLPLGWKEDTKDDMYDPDSFIFFENEESCLFFVIVGKKSAGMTVDQLLKYQKISFEAKLTGFTSSTFDVWSKYQGKGIELNGKMGGAIKYNSRLFGFENGDNVCLVAEAATPADKETFAADFETIRQTFKLK